MRLRRSKRLRRCDPAAADAVSRSPEGLRHFLQDVAQGFSPAVALALPAACAIEMIHTYSLIHDDLPAMDDDSLRRGRPTLHVLHGDGMAILAGDGLQAAAFTLLAREPADTEPAIAARKLRVASVIGEAAGPSAVGQAIDLQREVRRPRLSTAPRSVMHARKTGALIRAPPSRER
jgi:geranylgeranyl pyrophosphate synthase